MALTEEMIAGGLSVEAASAYNQPAIAIEKPKGKYDTRKRVRIVVDQRQINSCTEKVCFPLMPTHQALDMAAGFSLYSCSDCVQGFHQMKLHPSIQHKLAYSVGTRRLIPLRLSMGAVNAMSAFCFSLSRAMGCLANGCCELNTRNIEINEVITKFNDKNPEQCVDNEAEYDDPQQFAPPGIQEQILEDMTIEQTLRFKHWMKLAKQRYPIEDGGYIDPLPHPCTGVKMSVRSHHCRAVAYVDDLLNMCTPSQDKNESFSEYRQACEAIHCIKGMLTQLEEHGIQCKA